VDFATASPSPFADSVECGSCAELIALAVALHLLLNFDFEQIAKNDGPKGGRGSEWGRQANREQQSLDCGIVDCY